jgi:HTH-type transcriptional regulator/antitoxin HigA
MNQYLPDYLVTPGELLEEYMESYNLTSQTLADKTGLNPCAIEYILSADLPITVKIAEKFGEVFQTSAQFWINMEKNYQDDKVRLGL